MNKLKAINIEECNYIQYRKWLQELSYVKEKLTTKLSERTKTETKITELKKEILANERIIYQLNKEIDETREIIMQAIPNKF